MDDHGKILIYQTVDGLTKFMLISKMKQYGLIRLKWQNSFKPLNKI